MLRDIDDIADELPDPLPVLIRDALKADEPYERSHKLAVATEMLTKWLVATTVSRLEVWPRLLRRQFYSGVDELRPTFGTWLRWAEASRTFSSDEFARRALTDAKSRRDAWAHFYQSAPEASSLEHVGTATWWSRLLSGPCVQELRAGKVEATPNWPSWSCRGLVSSLEPWVHVHEGKTLLLHHISWETGRGAYVSYFGAPVAVPLSPRFRLQDRGPLAREPLKFTRTGQAVASAMADRRARWIVLVGGQREGAELFAREAETREHVSVRHVAHVADVPTVVGDLVASGTGAGRSLVVTSCRAAVEAIRDLVGQLRTVELLAPTAADVLTAISRVVISMPLEPSLAAHAVAAFEGDAEALDRFLCAARGNPPTDARQFRQLVHESNRVAEPAVTRSGVEPIEDGPELSWRGLEIHYRTPPSTRDESAATELRARVRERGLQLARSSLDVPIAPEWGYWLRRWMPEAAFAATAAARSLAAWRASARRDASLWLSQIRRCRDSASGHLDAVTGFFVAAALRELLVEGLPHAVAEEAVRALPIESLVWLRSILPPSLLSELLLFECGVARFDRDYATGRGQLVRAAVGMTDAFEFDLDAYGTDELGRAARALHRRDGGWGEHFERWSATCGWKDPPPWVPWSLEPEHLAVPKRVSDLAVEVRADVAAKVAISGVRQFGMDSEWMAAAEALIQSIQDPYWRAERLRDLVEALIHTGESERAARIAERIDYPRFRVESTLTMARWVDDPERAATLLGDARNLVSALDRAQIRREYWPKVLDTSLAVSSPREEDVRAVLSHLDEEGAPTLVTGAWMLVAGHGRTPNGVRSLAIERTALLPGVLAPFDGHTSNALPACPTGGEPSRRVGIRAPCRLRLSREEWSSLREGVAMEAVVSPGRMADFAGLISSEIAYQTASFFSLRLGGAFPRFSVETSHGVFDAVSPISLARLEPDQPPYRICGVFDGRRLSLWVDGSLRASGAAAGRVRLRDGELSVGEQQPGFRPFGGVVHEVRLWGLVRGRWLMLLEGAAS